MVRRPSSCWTDTTPCPASGPAKTTVPPRAASTGWPTAPARSTPRWPGPNGFVRRPERREHRAAPAGERPRAAGTPGPAGLERRRGRGRRSRPCPTARRRHGRARRAAVPDRGPSAARLGHGRRDRRRHRPWPTAATDRRADRSRRPSVARRMARAWPLDAAMTAARSVDGRARWGQPGPMADAARSAVRPSRVHSSCASQPCGVTSRARVPDTTRLGRGGAGTAAGRSRPDGSGRRRDARAVPPTGAPQPTARARSGGRAPSERCHRPWPSSP